MPDLVSLLDGYRDELRSAVKSPHLESAEHEVRKAAEDRVSDIRSEIAKLEKTLQSRPSLADRRAAQNRALAGPTERATSYLAALREEKQDAAKKGDTVRIGEIDAEIARVEAGLKPAVTVSQGPEAAVQVGGAERRGPGRPRGS